MNCPYCDISAERVQENREVRLGKRSATVEHEFYRCPDCGEEFFVGDQMDRVHSRAIAKIRQEEGLLTPSEIRRIREGYALTQTDFEQLLGVGPKTVVRWESGKVFQNAATDTLLRVIQEFPMVARFLAGERGVSLSRIPSGSQIGLADFVYAGGKAAIQIKATASPKWSGLTSETMKEWSNASHWLTTRGEAEGGSRGHQTELAQSSAEALS